VADQPVVETVGLEKDYDGAQALAGLSIGVPRGSICGLLGRNGAGKTTTLKILLGMVRATGGEARVFGLSARDAHASVAIRSRSAFVSEEKDLYDSMTVEQIIRFTASFYPRWRADLAQQYLRTLDLPPGRTVKQLSRGMRTKLALLLALASGAELLMLDEPTSGLDPAATEEVLRTLVAHAGREGTTVLFSSHQLADVEQVADRVVIVDRGRALVEGVLDELRARYRRIQLVFDGAAPDAALRAPGVVATRRQGRVLTVLSSAGADGVVEEARGLAPVSVDVLPVTLKEIFLETVVAAEG
jgi:ABC-2 type transport system ATP-binding protein